MHSLPGSMLSDRRRTPFEKNCANQAGMTLLRLLAAVSLVAAGSRAATEVAQKEELLAAAPPTASSSQAQPLSINPTLANKKSIRRKFIIENPKSGENPLKFVINLRLCKTVWTHGINRGLFTGYFCAKDQRRRPPRNPLQGSCLK